jgi:ComF family protein
VRSRVLGGGRWLVDRLLPRDCLLCAAATRRAPICTGCAEELPRMPRACPVCSMPSALGETCGACLRKPPAFDRTIVAFPYGFPIDRLVQGFKFGHRLPIAAFLADAMADALADASPAVDLIVPMPLGPVRLRERGFNQSVELARRVAARRGMPCAVEGARRIRDTRPQTELSPAERRRNVRGAFEAGGAVIGRRVAVVDDVMTTGASLAELARTLKSAGALYVENWVVARAFGPDRSAD